MAQMYRTYDKFDDAEKKRIAESATTFLASVGHTTHRKIPASGP